MRTLLATLAFLSLALAPAAQAKPKTKATKRMPAKANRAFFSAIVSL